MASIDHTVLPPPPYSETDIYSRSGTESSPTAILTPTTSQADNASVANRRTSVHTASSSDEADGAPLTPPYSPSGDGSFHQNPFGRGFDEPEHTTSSPAEAYFESRRARRGSNTILIHTIKFADDLQPKDFPYPEPAEAWLEREVLPQDWQTFVNYLIPHHADVSNNDLADRKLKAELIDERMSRLTLDQDVHRMVNMDHVEAHLEPLRKAQTENSGISDAETVVQDWNEGFFAPRGLKIEISQSQNNEGFATQMPGAWTHDMEEPEEDSRNCGGRRGGRGGRGFGRGRGGWGGGWGGGGMGRGGRGGGWHGWVKANTDGFHLGRGFLSADNDGFRMFGNGLVADKSGFRMGNFLAADERGFRLGRHTFGPGPGPVTEQAQHSHEELDREVEPTARGRRGDHREGGRRHRHRSRSSSSGSSSSSSSVESVGSLPDYDKLNEAQLPIAKQSIQNWLDHPDQPITREAVKNIIQEIKSAKKNSAGKNGDMNELRSELKGMMRSFKGIVKSQKQAMREEKRKRKAERREQKRLRKASRREERRERHGQKREARRGGRGNRRECGQPSGSSMPPVGMSPSGWPLEKGASMPQRFAPHVQPPSLSMPGAFPQIHPMGLGNPRTMSAPFLPSMAPIHVQDRGWPYMNNSQPGYDMGAAARLEAEGRRIEAEARGREARLHADEIRQQAEAIAAQHTYRAEVTSAINKQKAEATRIRAESQRMKLEVARMRTQAAGFKQSDQARVELLGVADRLEEEAEKTEREGDRLLAEAMQLAEDLETELTHHDSSGQQSGVIHN